MGGVLAHVVPLLNATIAAYIAVVSSILIGMFFTRDDRRNLENILSNIASFAILLATVDFPILVLAVMATYLLAGAAVAWNKSRRWFFLFGAKSYGSFSLALLLAHDRRLGLRMSPGLGPYGLGPIDLRAIDLQLLGMVLLVALVIAVVAHGVGYVYFRTVKPTRSAKQAGRTRRGGVAKAAEGLWARLASPFQRGSRRRR